ncbi:hypothetical protein [Prosthecobacter sp.]|uniref:hypothetical protein n=1 Tax=Prosthecobacter sp. TaxID=1965333 RepID=UPI0037848EDA
MDGEVMIVCGMVVVIAAILYGVIQGLRRGPKLPAAVLLAAVLLLVVASVVHDFTQNEILRTLVGRLALVFFPLGMGVYAHALRSRSGL